MKNNILDLSCYLEKTMTVKMPDGRQYTLPKPTQRVFIMSLDLYKLSQSNPSYEEQLEAINKYAYVIMNENKQGRTFTMDEIENLPMDAKSAIIKAYTDFAQELVNDPN